MRTRTYKTHDQMVARLILAVAVIFVLIAALLVIQQGINFAGIPILGPMLESISRLWRDFENMLTLPKP